MRNRLTVMYRAGISAERVREIIRADDASIMTWDDVFAERDTLRAEVVAYQAALADERGRHATAEMALRAEVERLREIREIARQCAANGGYLNSRDLIDLRNLLEATK